jgi:enoyl-[acyl-carrier-protein] reductase (NADH)
VGNAERTFDSSEVDPVWPHRQADVANIVLFLALDFSDCITEATLYIDGGIGLYPAFRGNG